MNSSAPLSLSEPERARLIGAAYRLMQYHGPAAVTVVDTARLAELPPDQAEAAFPSDAELTGALFETVLSGAFSVFEEAVDETEDPDEQLHALLDQIFSLMEEGSFADLLFDLWSHQRHDEELTRISREYIDSLRGRMARILSAGMEEGLFAPGDAMFMAATIMSLIHGAIVQHACDPERFDEDWTRRFKDYILQLLVE